MGIRRAALPLPVVAVLLTALLVLGGIGTTVARAHLASLTAMELCGLNGPATVLIDAQGNPAAPLPACPDCIAGLALAGDPTGAAASLPRPARRVSALVAPLPDGSPATGLPPVRAPPVPV